MDRGFVIDMEYRVFPAKVKKLAADTNAAVDFLPRFWFCAVIASGVASLDLMIGHTFITDHA